MKISQILLPSFTIFFQLQLFLLLSSTQLNGQPIRVKIGGTRLPASNSKSVKLISRKHTLFVSIDQSGKVSAVVNCKNNYTDLEMSTVGVGGLVTIKGVQSGRFLAMNSAGQIYSTKKVTDETVFKNTQLTNGWETFASEKYYISRYYDAFLAITRAGKTKNAKKTNQNNKASQFLVITSSTCQK
ncbi:fibroblast growth factor 2 [Exaiptasia diaphana]|uniref:Fibroblast growth factor n=1 Tax=Exaiptasia diaphana TaxID=2652724 RepID=A0A913Y0C0_EXADI|nr:fibroblast growth factor 2 [Exaiptasia diaphana]